MSTTIRKGLTTAGLALIARNLAGENITFTRIAVGQGILPPEQPIGDLMDVIDPVLDIEISKFEKRAGNTVVVGGMLPSTLITTEYFDRERALFAHGEDGAEVLYCYRNTGDNAVLVQPIVAESIQEKFIDIITAVGDTEHVTANIVRATTADEIRYDDRLTDLGAGNVQEAIVILAFEQRQILESIQIAFPSLHADLAALQEHMNEILRMFGGQGSADFFFNFLTLNGLQLIQGVHNTIENRIEY